MLAVNEENTAARKFYSFLNFKKAAGPYVWVLSLLYRNKEILTINMKKNRDWLNTGDSGYKYMGIR